jgi:hypothetical protein
VRRIETKTFRLERDLLQYSLFLFRTCMYVNFFHIYHTQSQYLGDSKHPPQCRNVFGMWLATLLRPGLTVAQGQTMACCECGSVVPFWLDSAA